MPHQPGAAWPGWSARAFWLRAPLPSSWGVLVRPPTSSSPCRRLSSTAASVCRCLRSMLVRFDSASGSQRAAGARPSAAGADHDRARDRTTRVPWTMTARLRSLRRSHISSATRREKGPHETLRALEGNGRSFRPRAGAILTALGVSQTPRHLGDLGLRGRPSTWGDHVLLPCRPPAPTSPRPGPDVPTLEFGDVGHLPPTVVDRTSAARQPAAVLAFHAVPG